MYVWWDLKEVFFFIFIVFKNIYYINKDKILKAIWDFRRFLTEVKKCMENWDQLSVLHFSVTNMPMMEFFWYMLYLNKSDLKIKNHNDNEIKTLEKNKI